MPLLAAKRGPKVEPGTTSVRNPPRPRVKPELVDRKPSVKAEDVKPTRNALVGLGPSSAAAATDRRAPTAAEIRAQLGPYNPPPSPPPMPRNRSRSATPGRKKLKKIKKKKKPAKKREPSEYNVFMSEGLARLREAGSNQAHLDRFTTVAGWWRTGERDARHVHFELNMEGVPRLLEGGGKKEESDVKEVKMPKPEDRAASQSPLFGSSPSSASSVSSGDVKPLASRPKRRMPSSSEEEDEKPLITAVSRRARAKRRTVVASSDDDEEEQQPAVEPTVKEEKRNEDVKVRTRKRPRPWVTLDGSLSEEGEKDGNEVIVLD